MGTTRVPALLQQGSQDEHIGFRNVVRQVWFADEYLGRYADHLIREIDEFLDYRGADGGEVGRLQGLLKWLSHHNAIRADEQAAKTDNPSHSRVGGGAAQTAGGPRPSMFCS